MDWMATGRNDPRATLHFGIIDLFFGGGEADSFRGLFGIRSTQSPHQNKAQILAPDLSLSLQFAQHPPPSDADVEKLLRRIAARIDALVQRHRDDAVDDDDPDALQQSLAEAAQVPSRHPWEIYTSPPKPQQGT